MDDQNSSSQLDRRDAEVETLEEAQGGTDSSWNRDILLAAGPTGALPTGSGVSTVA
jgi:hypothetical protein